MKIGLDISQHQLSWDELVERARFADQAGFDSAWVFDHFQPLYGDRTGPCLEGWSLLAALAVVTERVRLGALVTGVTYRHPSILAAQAVTVDHVSGGRLDIGMGAAWFQAEHDALGIDFPHAAERAQRLDEALEVMRLLMTTDGASFEGQHYQLRDATYGPKPIQRPHPPFWIGAGGPRLTLPLVGKHADVWHGFGGADALTERWAIVRDAAERAGRDPATITRSTNLSCSEPWDEVLQNAEHLAASGITYLIASWPGAGRARMDEFVRDVMPTLRAL